MSARIEDEQCIEGRGMLVAKVVITRYEDDAQPGWVECKLVDAWGRSHTFIEKVPVVAVADYLDAKSSYPQPGIIACQILERKQCPDGREVVTVTTEAPWHIESITAESRFDLLPEQLTDFN